MCSGTAIQLTCCTQQKQLILTAAHCFAMDVDEDAGTTRTPWSFEFTNVKGVPTAQLTKLWRSQRGNTDCLERWSDFAVAEFTINGADTKIPAAAYGKVADKPAAKNAAIVVHGIRGQYADGSDRPDDLDNVFEASVKVAGVSGYSIQYSSRVLVNADSGGRVSSDGVVVGVNSGNVSAASYGGAVTTAEICALIKNDFKGDCSFSCSLAKPTNPVTVAQPK
jgi:hypothetical protein